MKTVSMSGSRRESLGKKDAKKHRKEGKVPCVLYGGKEEIHFVASERDFDKILFTPETYFIKLDIDGSEHDCILKEIQYHPVSDHVLHADFLEFTNDMSITTSIPVKFHGNAPGLMKGGQLIKKFRKLSIRALPADMPEAIVIDISNLELNDKIKVSDIPQEKFKILDSPESYVVGIRITRLSAETPEGEEGAAAEVPVNPPAETKS